MRPSSAALATFLADPTKLSAAIIDLYTFSLVSGTVLRYSSWVKELVLPSSCFVVDSLNAGATRTFTFGPTFGRTTTTNKVGIDPSGLDISIQPAQTDLVGTITFQDAFQYGLFDGATIELDRLVLPAGGDGITGPFDNSLGTVIWFYGTVTGAEIGRSAIKVTCKNLMNLLAIQQMPKRIYQASCNHDFGGPMCGYNRITGTNALGVATGIGAHNVTALGGSDQTQIVTAFTPGVATSYDQGTITCLTGNNTGQMRTILYFSSSIAHLPIPWLFPVTPGDTFQLLPGCDRTVATCNGPLNNFLRYGGYPYIPPPEQSI